VKQTGAGGRAGSMVRGAKRQVRPVQAARSGSGSRSSWSWSSSSSAQLELEQQHLVCHGKQVEEAPWCARVGALFPHLLCMWKTVVGGAH
jgi:hypothetical protein